MSITKPRPDATVEGVSFRLAQSDELVTIGKPTTRWTMLFVYRGRHCPRCKKFLNKLSAMYAEWQAVMDVFIVSADTKAKALDDVNEFGWHFDVGYGLTEPQMRALGLYVSQPLSEAETTDIFAEPGSFAFRPDGTLMLVDISNGPAARPDLDELLDGMKFNIENNRPARGTA